MGITRNTGPPALGGRQQEDDYIKRFRFRFIHDDLPRRVTELGHAVETMIASPADLTAVREVSRLIHSLFGSCRIFGVTRLIPLVEPCNEAYKPLFFNPRPVDAAWITVARTMLSAVEANLGLVRTDP